MQPFSFVHAADLHIDSPFRGVTVDAPDMAKDLCCSTFRAYDALIDLTVKREADFLLIAGDVYDSQDRSLKAQLSFRDGLSRLDSTGIDSFIVHGNHDPLDSRMTSLNWPRRAHFFGRSLRSVPACGPGGQPLATVSGISFPRKAEARNLASLFRRQKTDLFQIGLLHCNVGGNTGHDNYAPCTLEDLRGAGMDYWALGHVHTRAILHEAPWIVYPGNIQGRSIREPGARGCYHVRVDAQGQITAEFIPLDDLRWSQIQVLIDHMETMDAVEEAIIQKIEAAATAAEGRSMVCRLSIAGRGSLHGELRRHGTASQLLERMRERFSGVEPFIWLQRIGIDSRPRIDLDERRRRQDLLAEVLETAKECRETPGGLATLYAGALAELWDSSRVTRLHLESPADDKLSVLLKEAEYLCMDLLEEDS